MRCFAFPLASIFGLFSFGSAGAMSDQTADAYCDLVTKKADQEAATLYAPSLVIRGEGRAVSDGAKANEGDIREPSRRYAVALEWGLQDFFRGRLKEQSAYFDCRRFTTRRQAEGSINHVTAASRAAGLAAKLDIYRGALADFERDLEKLHQRLQVGTAAIPDVDTVSDAIATLKIQILEHEQELRRLQNLVPTGAEESPSALPKALAAWREAEQSLAAKAQDELDAQAWQLKFFGGLERTEYQATTFTRTSENGPKDIRRDATQLQRPVLGVEFRLALGSLGAGRDVGAAQRRWTEQAQDLPQAKANDLNRELEGLLPTLDQKIQVASERVAELDHFLKVALNTAPDGDFMQRLKLKRTFAAAELKGFSAEATKLKALVPMQSLGIKTAANLPKEAAAPKNVSAAPTALPALGPFEMHVLEPTYRFHKLAKKAEGAEIDFVVKSVAETKRTLGSGEVREQLGLMLRQKDQCNLVYVMWRLGKSPEIVVQEKVNPGQSTHEQCGNHGYTRIKPEKTAPPPALAFGEKHNLKAKIDGRRLTVTADGKEVWVGPQPKKITQGPNIGFRSDNLVVDYNLRELSE